MQKLQYWLTCGLPVALWMGLIFLASGDSASFVHSSRIIGPLLHWLAPHLSDQAVQETVLLARKSAHVAEYALLAWLLLRAVRRFPDNTLSPWRWSQPALALALATLYAASDEFHQTFVPSRDGCVRDVFIDSAGASLALFAAWLRAKYREDGSPAPDAAP